jgi:hypothetical protein
MVGAVPALEKRTYAVAGQQQRPKHKEKIDHLAFCLFEHRTKSLEFAPSIKYNELTMVTVERRKSVRRW